MYFGGGYAVSFYILYLERPLEKFEIPFRSFKTLKTLCPFRDISISYKIWGDEKCIGLNNDDDHMRL